MIAESDPLYVESVGEGPLVLLAHGFTGSARNWRPQVRALRDRYRVVLRLTRPALQRSLGRDVTPVARQTITRSRRTRVQLAWAGRP